jgi:hypothetical protein
MKKLYLYETVYLTIKASVSRIIAMVSYHKRGNPISGCLLGVKELFFS